MKKKIPKRIKKISIESFRDLQDVLMDHDIPMASSISGAMKELLEIYDQQGYDEIYILINKDVAPPSYYMNGVLWGKALSPDLDIPFVRTYIDQKQGQLVIYAGHNKIEPNFYRRIQDRLKHKKIIILPLPSVPRAYRVNPYILVTRLRKKKKNPINIRVDMSTKTLTITKLN